MPLKPYIYEQDLIVVKKVPGYLDIETSSGRSVLLIPMVLMLLIQEDWVKYPGLLLCLMVWTYSKRWCIERGENRISSCGRILGIEYERIVHHLASTIELFVDRTGGPEGVGWIYRLRVRFDDTSVQTVTTRNKCASLLPIIDEIKRFIPAIEVRVLPDCGRKRKP